MKETNHDSHYVEIEKKLGIQPIVAGEYIAGKDCIPRVPAKHLGTATEYLLRAGDKGDWRADARKAMNHIHRALHGFWMPVQIEVELAEAQRTTMTMERVREVVRKASNFGWNHGRSGTGCDVEEFIQENGLSEP